MLIIKTPNSQQEDGNSRLQSYTFSGELGRKFFILENQGGSPESLTLSLSLIGGSGGFKIYPAESASIDQTTLPLVIEANQQVAFSVDYNSSWGDATIANLSSDTPIYTVDSTGASTGYVLLGPGVLESINFSAEDNSVLTKREIGSLLMKNKNGDYQVAQAYTKITEDETSFGLVRTNPKLTGNVKITVDSSESVWLNSIDAVKELSDDRFKKYRVGSSSSYVSDVNKFFDFGTTPSEIVFALYQEDEQYTSTKRSLDKQYDRFYQYGVTQLDSKFYNEDFSFFAPLYLKNEIPEYFVIFRTDGPINKFTYETPFEEWPENVVSEILSKSQIIKTFSLGENTIIGSYLRNIVNHPSRKDSDISVSYQKNGYTTFNGILYSTGAFAEMGELLFDYINEENPLITVEEFITLGFERNKVFSSHVINLEFLFDDPDADNYSINRYFGLYVNAIDLARFTISEGGLQEYSFDLGQLPLPRKNVDGNKLSQKSFVQTNPNGISVFAESSTIKRTKPLTRLDFTSVITSLDFDMSDIRLSIPGNYESRLSIGRDILIESSTGFTGSGVISDFSYSEDYTEIVIELSTYNSSVSIPILLSSGNLSCDFYDQTFFQEFEKRVLDNSFIENSPRLFFLRDNENKLHTVDSTETLFYYEDPFTSVETTRIQLRDKRFDMSLLSGFSEILTQSRANSLSTRGKSSMTLEVTGFLDPNDYIEISWSPGATSLGYPLRWKVIANDTATNPGDSWPSYTIATDSEGEYYLAYFNPGDSSVALEIFAKSIQDAFNRFPYKNFEVVSKGSKLHFRSTQEGRISESAKLKFYSANSSMKLMGVQGGISGETNFIGGSNRFHTRAKISRSVAEGMLLEEYASTKGGFSKIRTYEVLGETLIFSPYFEEPVYDEDGEILIDFTDSEEYRVISLEDENQPFQLTSDRKVTTYEIFKPSYGILSILPLRDFDTDYFLSDYTRNYLPELIEYFGRYASPATVNSITLNSPNDIYTFDKEFEFENYPIDVPFLEIFEDGSSAVLHNKKAQFRFSSPGATAELLIAPGGTSIPVNSKILFMPGVKHTYFSDKEISKFTGFPALSGVVSEEDETLYNFLEAQWDPERFTFQLLDTEYDRLAENFLKSLALKSRVVPYSLKWVSPQGKDIRDNSYRFNYHRSFGNMGFSPSDEISESDARFHSHEWPYLHAVPDKFPIAEYPEFAFSYMFETLSDKYDFTSLKKDWFSDYFSVGYPTEQYYENGNLINAKIDPTERYAYFNYQDYDDQTTALFRGYKLSIKEIDSSGSPVNLSTKYNNYKFSAIIETVENDVFNTTPPISFKTIVNEKWKFILLRITVRVNSYRFTRGRLKYTDFYTLSDSDEIAIFGYDPLYSPELLSYIEAIPVDKTLSTPIDFDSYSSDSTLPSNVQFYDTIGNDFYKEDLRDEIVTLENGNFSNLIATYSTNMIVRYSVVFPVINDIYSRNTIQMPISSGINIKVSTLPVIISSAIPYSFSWENFTFYHHGGGDSSLKGLREQLSFSEILKVMTGISENSTMEYEIYDENGQVSNLPNFKFSGISPEKLTRIYDYYPVSDQDKPQEFYTFSEIGNVLEDQKDLQTIYRYQGDFSPKFRDVLKFWMREDEIFTSVMSRDFLFNNTHLGVELKNFSILKNQYYSKVSQNEILRLSENSGYLPVYPLVDEIAIDKRDIFGWSSSWDNDYYRFYTSVSEYVSQKGTLEMRELKSLMGSKVMKVPRQYDLHQFSVFEAPSDNLSPFTENEFSYHEGESMGYLQVNVYNRLLREMLGTSTDNRAREEFLKSIDLVPGSFELDTLDEYVTDYLKKNILDLFEISEVKLYILQTGDPGNGVISTIEGVPRPFIETTQEETLNVTLSETSLISKGYLIKKDTKLTQIENLIFSIEYPLDSRFYTSLSVGVTVRRI